MTQKTNQFKIDFTGVGFPKCGTTWVGTHLSTHPEVNFCKHKETNYFSSDELVSAWKSDFATMRRIQDLKNYKSLFEKDNDGLKGEFSVYYAYDIAALQKLKQHNADVKLLVCLRDPLSAAFSHYRFVKNSLHSQKMSDSFEKELLENEDLKTKYSFSIYVEHILEIFSPQNVLFIDFQKIKQSPEEVYKEICKFLEISDSTENLQLSSPIHETRKMPDNVAFRLLKKSFPFLRRLVGNEIIGFLYPKIYNFLPKAKKISVEQIASKKVNSFFNDETNKLEEMLAKHNVSMSWFEQ